jgi:hypothetical protein
MKKSRIFMGAAALTLAIAGFLSVNANKKFFGEPQTLYLSVSNVLTPVLQQSTINNIFNTVGTGNAVYMYNGSAYKTLFYKTGAPSAIVHTSSF